MSTNPPSEPPLPSPPPPSYEATTRAGLEDVISGRGQEAEILMQFDVKF